MKKIVFSLIFILSALSIFSQDFEPVFTMGLNSGLDYDINAYQIPINQRYNYQYFSRPEQYNIGMDFGVALTKRIRTRVELRYVNSQYGVRWNVGITDPSQAFDMQKSIQNINNFDLNFHFDYLLTTWKKLDIYVSPGVKYEFATGDYLHTFLSDGPSTSTNWAYLYPAFPKNIGAGSLDLLFKYNFTKHFGLTITPDYTLFFRPYDSSNWQWYQRLSLNAGFEFRFN